MFLGNNIGSFYHVNLVFTHKRKLRTNTRRFNSNKPKKSTCHHTYTRAEIVTKQKLWQNWKIHVVPNSKTQIVTKPNKKYSNCDKAEQLKMRQN